MKLSESEREQAKRQVARLDDYRKTFTSPHGQRVLFDMMKAHFVLSSTFVKGDPHSSAAHEGERQVVIRILAKMNVNIERMKALIEGADDAD